MATVRFLRGTGLGGIGNDAAPGDERDLPDGQAAQLIATGRAVACPPAAAAPTLSDEDTAAPPTRKKGK